MELPNSISIPIATSLRRIARVEMQRCDLVIRIGVEATRTDYEQSTMAYSE
jgi:hypothetical protein